MISDAGHVRALVFLAAWVLAEPAFATDFFSGSQLLESCGNQTGLTSGYIAGWIDKQASDKFVMAATMRNHMDDKRLRGAERKMSADVCMRESVTVTQATEIFCKYLAQNPAARHQTPGDALASALSTAWPCPGDEN